MDILKRLNPEQQEAVTYFSSPLCILAGAGTGKTRVITNRIAYLVETQGVRPEQILAVTFTNKAAKEMQERVDKLLPGVGRRVWVGTFHGIAARMLRMWGARVGVAPNFLIYDADDTERLLKKIAVDDFGIAKDRAGDAINAIGKWQMQGFSSSEIPSSLDMHTNKLIEIFRVFEKRMAEMGALSFDGLLKKWLLLIQNEEGLQQIAQQIRHVLVDEYQDTNKVQAEIIQLLGAQAESVAIVGDDDQSIYGWRGASANNMQLFLASMPDAKLIRLERNYRSTSNILKAANRLIEKNDTRIGKNLVAQGEEGDKVRLIALDNDVREAQMVVKLAQDVSVLRGSLNDFVVLMRTNSQSRPIEDALRRAGLPYRLYGGVKFYDRKEVKDVLATLRVAVQPSSDVDVLRSFTAVPRGVGDTSIKKAMQLASARGLSLLTVFSQKALLLEAGLSSKAAQKTVDFSQRLMTLHEQLDLPADQVVALAVEISGIAERLQVEDTAEAEERLENLNQLLSAAKQYMDDELQEGVSNSIVGFLETASLLGSADLGQGEAEAKDAVTLMTLHAAKGLEFDTVALVGMEEYGFPHGRALDEQAGPSELEEERRLAYVGMTRAKRKLFMLYAKRRMIRGQVKGRIPSRFLKDVPLDVAEGDIPYFSKPLQPFSGFREERIQMEPVYTPVFEEEEVEIRKGTRVEHSIFGAGTVIAQRGMGRLKRIHVCFDQEQGERVIIARHLKVAHS